MIRYGTATEGGVSGVYALRDDEQAVHVADDFIEFLDAGEAAWDEASHRASADAGVPADSLEWLAPIPRPRKILCTFGNTPQVDVKPVVAQEPWPRPIFFLKAPTSVIGDGESIVIPADIGIVQPEAEFTVIIGKTMKHVPREDVFDYVFGYTLLNDITAATMSYQDAVTLSIPGRDEAETFGLRPMARYKGLDTFGPLGPYIVPKSEIPDPGEVRLDTYLNGDHIQTGKLSELRHDIPAVLEEFSKWVTLEPGDAVSMGTVLQTPGWPLRDTDLGRYGGEIEVRAEPIGSLRNPIIIETSNIAVEATA